MKAALLVLAVGVVGFNMPVSGHHSFPAHYFEDQSVSVEGELVEFEYRAPHAWVRVMAPDERGALQQFAAEWASPSRLTQLGVTKETLKPGNGVVVTGSPGRNPADRRRSIEEPAAARRRVGMGRSRRWALTREIKEYRGGRPDDQRRIVMSRDPRRLAVRRRTIRSAR